jgi:nucleoside-diphosphate-sugar epimerase
MAEDLTYSAAGHRGLITVFGGTGFLGRRIVPNCGSHLTHRWSKADSNCRSLSRLNLSFRGNASSMGAS